MTRKIGILICIIVLLAGSILLLNNKPQPLHLKKASFSQLPGWSQANTQLSLAAFEKSCRVFVKQNRQTFVGSPFVNITAQDWHPICHAALNVDKSSSKQVKDFFQTWFVPVAFYDNHPISGLFTGYYLPLLHGSLTKSERYHVPIYRVPSDLITVDLGQFKPELKNQRIVGRIDGQQFVPFYTREEINQGAIEKTASVIVWVDNPVDRLFLEIQGSGIVQLDDGSKLFVGYAGQNGAPYTAIGQVLIKKGVMTKENASMQAIQDYLEAHPKDIDLVLNQNKSFVFFETLARESAIGAHGIELTTGYSLAVDRKWVPMGVPIWLNTTRPAYHADRQIPFQRLMIAQDTGGAIRGMVRGDVFWGAGKRATAIAGKMKNNGHYWLLLPRTVAERLDKETKLAKR